MKNTILWICRILVGGLFIFSGLIKANDPFGFAIKLEEYYDVFASHWHWTAFFFNSSFMMNTTVLQAAFICSLEVALGIALLLGIFGRLVAWLLLLMILFFTWLTGYSAVTGAVTDCGCFGDFIKLTPLQSFEKDLVLLVLILIIFIFKKNIKPFLKTFPSAIIFLLVAGFATWVSIHVIQHDVFLDWRPYAVGDNIAENMSIPPNAPKPIMQMVYTYKSKSTGEEKTVIIPAKDDKKSDAENKAEYDKAMEELSKVSADNNYEFVSRKDKILKAAFTPKISDFAIFDENNDSITYRILHKKDYQFMVVSPFFGKTHEEGWKKINEVQKVAEQEGIFTFALVGENPDNIDSFRHANNTAFPFYTGDYKVCMTIMRSNPGILLLKEGTVIAKWSWRDLPDFSTIKQKYFPDRPATKLRTETDELLSLGDNVPELLAQNEKPYDEFFITDTAGTDVTAELFRYPVPVYMVIINEMSMDKLTAETWSAINPLIAKLHASGAVYFIVSSADPQLVEQMKAATGLPFRHYHADAYVLAKVMKENTGIVKIVNGTVTDKWVENHLPPLEQFMVSQ